MLWFSDLFFQPKLNQFASGPDIGPWSYIADCEREVILVADTHQDEDRDVTKIPPLKPLDQSQYLTRWRDVSENEAS